MADPTQTEQDASTGGTSQSGATPEDLLDELKSFGINLKEALRTVWESQERKTVQSELETGLKNLGSALDQAATEFRESGMGQQIKEDVEDLQERLRQKEIDTKVRTELFGILRTVNTELENLVAHKTPPEAPKTGGGPDHAS